MRPVLPASRFGGDDLHLIIEAKGGCGVVIKLSEGGYSQGPKGTLCEKCTRKSFPISKMD